MPPLIPARFLVRVSYPCRYLAGMPREDQDTLLDLPAHCRLDNFAGASEPRNFADVRLAWNEQGLGLQVSVAGKQQDLQGSIDRPKLSDGVTLWIDTRSDRTAHRAGRYCHQFHFLPAAAGPERDEPVFLPEKIHRALIDAPLPPASAVPFRCQRVRKGYRIEAFLPASALAGFDPDEHPRLGLYYAVRDSELGEQTLAVGSEFPFAEDPSLWQELELTRSGNLGSPVNSAVSPF